MRTVTPHFKKKALKYWHAGMRELMAQIRLVRELRASAVAKKTAGKASYILDEEEAEGLLNGKSWWEHKLLRDQIRDINSWTVEKYANLSPAAAARVAGRRKR